MNLDGAPPSDDPVHRRAARRVVLAALAVSTLLAFLWWSDGTTPNPVDVEPPGTETAEPDSNRDPAPDRRVSVAASATGLERAADRTVRAFVLDRADHPVENLTFEVRADENRDQVVRTGAGGACSFVVPPATRELAFESTDPSYRFVVPRRRLIDVTAEPIMLRVAKLGCELRGVVRDEDTGEPIGGAWLDVLRKRLAADANGRFRVAVGCARAEVLRVGADGYVPVWRTVHVGQSAGNLDVFLSRGTRLSGRVTDPGGAGIANARLRTFVGDAVADADGHFEVLAPTHVPISAGGNFLVTASHPDFCSRYTVVPVSQLDRPCRIVLTRACALTGVVTNAHGEAIPNAVVRVRTRGQPSGNDATTDAAGRFRLAAVPTGAQRLVVTAKGCGARSVDFKVSATGGNHVAIRMPVGHAVQGRVVDRETGEPVPFARIRVAEPRGAVTSRADAVLQRNAPFAPLPGSVRADEVGVFSLPAVGLPAVVDAAGFGYVTASARIDETGPAEIELTRSGRLRGIVVDARTGVPIPVFCVELVQPRLLPKDRYLTGYRSSWSSPGVSFTSDDGSWSTAGEELRPGTVAGVRVTADGFVSRTVHRVEVHSVATTPLVVELEAHD